MAEPEKAPSIGGSQESGNRVLRAKYLDYCSARVAEALLRLTADEMYVLAQEVAGETTEADGDLPSFNEIVRLATDRITRDLALPPFSEWVGAYRKDPQRFDAEMIGLWREDVKTSDHSVN